MPPAIVKYEPFQPYQLSAVGGSKGWVGRLIKSQTIENSFICYCLYSYYMMKNN